MKIQLSFSSSPYSTLKQQPNATAAGSVAAIPDQTALKQQLDQLAIRFRDAIAVSDYLTAHQAVKEVLALVPKHPTAKMDLAFTALRLERYQEAYQHYLEVLEMPASELSYHVYDGLVEVCLALELNAERQKYGALALLHKQREVEKNHILTFPKQRPEFDPSEPEENIISFALDSADPRYCESAILNVRYAQDIFPEWTCRFYINDAVPMDVQLRLKIAGAQVKKVPQNQQHYPMEFWRFLVMGDRQVKFFLIRDVNTLLSRRERAAVNDWLDSEYWFHHMRDYATHTELLLSAYLGGCFGPFKHIESILQQYWQLHQQTQKKDQEWYFLRQMWPTIARSLLMHDSQGYASNAVAFPDYVAKSDYEKAHYFYVGADLATPVVEVKVHEPDAKQVRWHLVDEQLNSICAYDSKVEAGKIRMNLPRPYAESLTTGQWKICLQPY
ncbi:tetratricopeptide repeat protein [Acinetobacter sp. B51(2017)]|uniref:tetratricopeptide repeat protein n=1 Tax=Acinetobacter sp. B51(2017) TaxID=2060938 RepID=UPI000F087678|nr:tetratricopeptide repeat protein [Acinetobacter sp. B51(2017)]